MMDTVPAAAFGSPSFDRRIFLATFAAAGVMAGATTALATGDGHDHPDAELLGLVAALHAAEAKWDEIDREADEHQIFDRCEMLMPAVPAPLFYQEGRDTWEICASPNKLPWLEVAGKECRHYAEEAHVPSLRWKITKWRQYGTGADVVDRAEEIVSALDPYVADVKRAEDVSGVTAFHETSWQNQALINKLYLEIAKVPARTAEGIAAKGHAASSPWSYDRTYLSAGLLPRMLAGEAGSFGDRPEIILAVSLIVDAMKLSSAAPTYSSEKVAA